MSVRSARLRDQSARSPASRSSARVRRRESLRGWAKRLDVSVSTVQRMEAGDPAVGMGVYLSALWVIDRANALGSLADPLQDRGALEVELRAVANKLPKPRARHG